MDQGWWRDNLAAVRESRLAKSALAIWGVSAAWDLLGREWMPASWGEKWPTAYEVVAKTTGYFPWWVWLIVGTLIVVAASLAYAGEQKRRADASQAFKVRSTGVAVAPSSPADALPLPDKPSIAVLPFTNMSGDPDQDYFSDGIAEDIITELSRFHEFTVIARNSSFHYKGLSPKIQDVGRQLGVKYVVEGSVRKIGNRVRVTTQLIEL